MAKKIKPLATTVAQTEQSELDARLDEQLYAQHVELKTQEDLESQRGTPIPALFNQFFKFVQNPSTVSVETYKRMVDTDDTVGSCCDFLVTCLSARIGRYTHPDKEITEFVNKAFDQMEGGFTNSLKDMLSATWVGFSVLEKVWANTDLGYIIKKMVPLPPGTILFETERTGELTPDGILQYQRNYNPGMSGVGFFGGAQVNGHGFDNNGPDTWAKVGDYPYPLRIGSVFNYLSIRIPVDKCVHFAFDAQGKFGNPYGRSLLRRAYKYYVLKDAFLKMMAIALDRKGTPLMVVFADPNSTMQAPGTSNQAKQPNARTKERADGAAARAFANVHNDSVIILPGKKDEIFSVQNIDQASNANDFIAAIGMCDRGLMRAMLVPSLIFTNGDGTGSFALGQEHAKTFDKVLDGMNAGATQVLLQQVVRELIAYNFPESKWRKQGLGSFGKRQLTKDEAEKEMNMLEKAINSGIVNTGDLNDLNQMRENIGFEPLEDLPEDMLGASGDAPATGVDGEPLDEAGASGAGDNATKVDAEEPKADPQGGFTIKVNPGTEEKE
jgi:hypothetical protein